MNDNERKPLTPHQVKAMFDAEDETRRRTEFHNELETAVAAGELSPRLAAEIERDTNNAIQFGRVLNNLFGF